LLLAIVVGVLASLCLLVAIITGIGSALPVPASPATPANATTRLVTISPAAGTIARDLGFQGTVVGRHAFDLVLDRSVRVCGDQAGLDYEALLAVGPTHVVTEWGSRELPRKFVGLARERGWRTLDIKTRTLEEIAHATASIDRFARNAEEGALLSPAAASLIGELDALRGVPDSPAFAHLGSVVPLVSLSPLGALGPGSCHHEVLVGIGAAPALATGGAYQELTREQLVGLAPGVIVYLRGGGPQEADAFASLRGLDIPAVRNNRLIVIDDPLCQIPATSLAALARDLRGRFSALK
jgi:ABC-type hemin transport system substrate-binding protein